MFVIVSYDVSDDKKRTMLFRRLRDYGFPVLKSVFEFSIPPEILEKVRGILAEHIDPASDSARIYFGCAECRAKAELVGKRLGPEEIDPTCWIV